MKLNEIKKYKTELAEEQAWKLINKHCSDALKTHKMPIVRGMNSNETGVTLVQGNAGHRSSKYVGSNFYTIILDAVLAPLGFPKRSASLICASWGNRYHAGGYGTKHVILPYNGVKIGICPESDIFGTDIIIGGEDNAINRWNKTFKAYGLEDSNISEFLRSAKDTYEKDQAGNKYYTDEKWLKEIAEGGIETLKKAYQKPFKLTTTADPIYNGDDGSAEHELWIGGKCIAIEMSLYRSIMQNYSQELN
jgi:hypothetical protein